MLFIRFVNGVLSVTVEGWRPRRRKKESEEQRERVSFQRSKGVTYDRVGAVPGVMARYCMFDSWSWTAGFLASMMFQKCVCHSSGVCVCVCERESVSVCATEAVCVCVCVCVRERVCWCL